MLITQFRRDKWKCGGYWTREITLGYWTRIAIKNCTCWRTWCGKWRQRICEVWLDGVLICMWIIGENNNCKTMAEESVSSSIQPDYWYWCKHTRVSISTKWKDLFEDLGCFVCWITKQLIFRIVIVRWTRWCFLCFQCTSCQFYYCCRWVENETWKVYFS